MPHPQEPQSEETPNQLIGDNVIDVVHHAAKTIEKISNTVESISIPGLGVVATGISFIY